MFCNFCNYRPNFIYNTPLLVYKIIFFVSLHPNLYKLKLILNLIKLGGGCEYHSWGGTIKTKTNLKNSFYMGGDIKIFTT